MTRPSDEVELSRILSQGEDEAISRLVVLLYEDLRGLARGQRRRGGTPLSLLTTELVHETFLKLAGGARVELANRAHFLALAARAMRQILVDYARKQMTAKRGGKEQRTTLDEGELAVMEDAERWLAIDEALRQLDSFNPRLARVVECRFFAGMADDETASALKVSRRTVQRDWQRAQLWLRRLLSREGRSVDSETP